MDGLASPATAGQIMILKKEQPCTSQGMQGCRADLQEGRESALVVLRHNGCTCALTKKLTASSPATSWWVLLQSGHDRKNMGSRTKPLRKNFPPHHYPNNSGQPTSMDGLACPATAGHIKNLNIKQPCTSQGVQGCRADL